MGILSAFYIQCLNGDGAIDLWQRERESADDQFLINLESDQFLVLYGPPGQICKSINNCWLTVNRVETDQISPNIQTSLAHIFDLLIALVKFPWEPLQYSTVVSIK